MNSYERVMNRMEGKPVDRLPNLNIFMLMPAKLLGIPYGQYVTDYRKLVEGVEYCYEKFETDCYCVISDPMRETEGLGATVVVPDDNVPYCPEPFLKNITDISKVKVVDPGSSKRMEDRLQAVRVLSEKARKKIPVIGWVEGAFAESCDLMDMSDVMMNLLDEPEAMQELLEICQKQAIAFALEQVRCGADIIGVGDAAASLIGPGLYEEFVLPYEIELFQAIHDAGAKVKLHICGNITEKLPLIAKSGADILDCDHMVSMELAAQALPSTCSISGNIDPVAILRGNKLSIFEEVRKCMGYPNRNIIAAGCEIPRDTPPENLDYMIEAIHIFSENNL